MVKCVSGEENVNVFFVDYGDSLDVTMSSSSLLVIRSDFVDLPTQVSN